jgi:hypothetical protein
VIFLGPRQYCDFLSSILQNCLSGLITIEIEILPITVWAADFETPVSGSTFFSFFFFLGSISGNKQ